MTSSENELCITKFYLHDKLGKVWNMIKFTTGSIRLNRTGRSCKGQHRLNIKRFFFPFLFNEYTYNQNVKVIFNRAVATI